MSEHASRSRSDDDVESLRAMREQLKIVRPDRPSDVSARG
jgi:hypothetical protein